MIICVNKKSLDFSKHLRAQSWLWRKAKIQHALGQARSREDVPDVRIILLWGKGKQFKKAIKKKTSDSECSLVMLHMLVLVAVGCTHDQFLAYVKRILEGFTNSKNDHQPG